MYLKLTLADTSSYQDTSSYLDTLSYKESTVVLNNINAKTVFQW